MTPWRWIGLIGSVIALPIGMLFGALFAAIAFAAGLILRALTWLKVNPAWLRPLWYGGLLVAGGILLYAHPNSVVGGAASSCGDLPALPLPQSEAQVAAADLHVTPQQAYVREVQAKRLDLLSQATLMERAHQLLPEVRAVARAFAASDSAQAASLAVAADQFQQRLTDSGMNSIEAIRARSQDLAARLNQFVEDIERDGAALDIAVRRDQLARLINEHSFDALYTSMSTLTEAMNHVVRQHGGLTYRTAYEVAVKGDHILYQERVDLHLSHGHFVNLDLREFAAQAALAGQGTEISVGGDGLAPDTYSAKELESLLSLSTRPSSVWVAVRTRIRPAVTNMCPGVSVLPFQKMQLAWPHRMDLQIRGATQLPLSNEHVPFTERIEKRRAHLSQVLLPRYALFVQSPALLKPAGTTRDYEAGVIRDRFEPNDPAAGVRDFAMTAELLPDTPWIRNQKVYAHRDLFFPVNWATALFYLAIASAFVDLVFRRRDQ